MTVAQKLPFELVALDGASNGFTDAGPTADALAAAILAIPGLDRSKLIVCGGWESATRGAGVVMPMDHMRHRVERERQHRGDERDS